jgi:hypothetical protein
MIFGWRARRAAKEAEEKEREEARRIAIDRLRRSAEADALVTRRSMRSSEEPRTPNARDEPSS